MKDLLCRQQRAAFWSHTANHLALGKIFNEGLPHTFDN